MPLIAYRNTDLDLVSPGDLTRLAAALDARGLVVLHVGRRDDGTWLASFETGASFTEPDPNIAALLDALESLDDPEHGDLAGCTARELNLGYDCGGEPWAFNQPVSAGCIRRMAAFVLSLRITLYPRDQAGRSEVTPEAGSAQLAAPPSAMAAPPGEEPGRA